MAGRKFGATGDIPLTWAMNVQVPAMVAEVFKASRIVAFSTGCVYPFVPVASGGASEDVPAVPPPGDYATSCVGRERMFEYFSARHGTPGRLCRLNDSSRMVKEFGRPAVPLAKMIEWTADWLARDMATLDKPTHYEVRDGKY